MKQVGSRIGAIQSANQEEVRLYGYGVYVGDEVPPEGAVLLGHDLHVAGIRNPKLVLDNGDVIWRCQGWWGWEEQVQASIKGRRVVIVPVPGNPPENGDA